MGIQNSEIQAVIEQFSLSESEGSLVHLAGANADNTKSAGQALAMVLVSKQLENAARVLSTFDHNLQAQIKVMNQAQEKWQSDAFKLSRSLTRATWVLAFLTGVLAIATIVVVFAPK